MSEPPLKLVLRAAGVALAVGVAVVFLLAPTNGSPFVRAIELVVRRAERLAGENLAVEPGESEFLELDPLSDDDFEELVRDALDELPDLLQNALAHVAVVISDGGRRAGAYGLYQGGGAHRHADGDRIVIFRDTLRRDFGADPDLLHEQVVRVVRHELAHHVGFDEMGVGELGL